MSNGWNIIKKMLGCLLILAGVCGMFFFGLCTFLAITIPKDVQTVVRIVVVMIYLLAVVIFLGLFLLGLKCIGRKKAKQPAAFGSGKVSSAGVNAVRVRCESCGAQIQLERGKTGKCDYCGEKIQG